MRTLLLVLIACSGAPRSVGDGCNQLSNAICERALECMRLGVTTAHDARACAGDLSATCCDGETCSRELADPDHALSCASDIHGMLCSYFDGPMPIIPHTCDGSLRPKPLVEPGGSGGGSSSPTQPSTGPVVYNCDITIRCQGVANPIIDFSQECASTSSEAERAAEIGTGCPRSAICTRSSVRC